MNRGNQKGSKESYVGIAPATPVLQSVSSNGPAFLPTPHPDARIENDSALKTDVLQGTISIDDSRRNLGKQSTSLSRSSFVLPHNQHPTTTFAIFPPVDRAQQLPSTPSTQVLSSEDRATLGQGLHTPPYSVARRSTQPESSVTGKMDDPRRIPNQRQMMGPPETPSRMMQASPNLFPSLQFSPDLFSAQNIAPMTAPAYPQQRLFWDPSTPTPQSATSDQYYNPYQDAFDSNFTSVPVTMENFAPVPSQDQHYELPMQMQIQPAFADAAGFPAPFQTSPRVPPVMNENPAQFLSSPARRFGGSETTGSSLLRRPAREVPAYHHQIEESRREMELERDRRRHKASQRADDELIMKSVRRALSPGKAPRPGLHRSLTHSGVTVPKFQQRHQARVSFNDAASASSRGSNTSVKNGRSSPLKRTSSAAGLTRSGSFQKQRTAVSLAIDENGLAKTVLEDLTESDDGANASDSSMSAASSPDQNDAHMLHSQPNSFAFTNDQDVLRPSQDSLNFSRHQPYDHLGQESAKRMNRLSLGSVSFTDAQKKRNLDDTIRASRRVTQVDTLSGKGDAQKALRAIIQDRSRSTSTQGDYPSSRQSDSSVQFHSSPPIQQNQFGALNVSPTTITDPDLATPSSDQDPYAIGTMRCICTSTSPNSSKVVQCDLCSKWLHATCIGINQQFLPESYICMYCEQTPMRHPANRNNPRSTLRGNPQSTSPLAHKSTRSQRHK